MRSSTSHVRAVSKIKYGTIALRRWWYMPNLVHLSSMSSANSGSAVNTGTEEQTQNLGVRGVLFQKIYVVTKMMIYAKFDPLVFNQLGEFWECRQHWHWRTNGKSHSWVSFHVYRTLVVFVYLFSRTSSRSCVFSREKEDTENLGVKGLIVADNTIHVVADHTCCCRQHRLLQTTQVVADNTGCCRPYMLLQTVHVVADNTGCCRQHRLLQTTQVVADNTGCCGQHRLLQTKHVVADHTCCCTRLRLAREILGVLSISALRKKNSFMG